MVRIILILSLVALQAAFGAPDYLLGTERYWVRALTYSFFHGNWWHLVVNTIAVWTIFQPRYKTKPLQFVAAFAIAVLVYPLSLRPAIGFSNILYAILGLRTPSIKSRWWRQPPVIIFIVITLAMLFIPRFSATTHIAAFLLGMAGASLKRLYHVLTKEARRYL